MAAGRKPTDALATAVAAADDYTAALLTLVNDAITDGRITIDASAADASIEAAFNAWRPGSAGPIVAAAHEVLRGYAAGAQRVIDGRGGGFSDGLRQQWQGNLATVDRMADEVLSLGSFAGQERLEQAERDLDAARQELAAQSAMLEQAVTDADIDTIMRLRTVVRVEIPGRIGDLTNAVLSLRHDFADESLRYPRRRLDDATAKAEGIVQEIQAAERRAEELRATLRTATISQSMAEYQVNEATRRRDASLAERDRHANAHADQQRAALRQLAGLAGV